MNRQVIILFAGILLVLSGGLLCFYWQSFLDHIISQKLTIKPGTKTYEHWAKSQVPLYMNFYFFNWTNPTHMKEPNYKPHFEQLGPYRFGETVEKVNIVWHENGTVSHKRVKKWFFEPEGSNGTLDDRVTTVNVITLSAARLAPSYLKVPLAFIISRFQEIYITQTVRDFLFDGYVDPLIAQARNVPMLSKKVPFDKFAWFYKRNGSSEADGVFNIETGVNGMDSFGQIKSWNYKNHTGFYPGHCGAVVGSGGEFWPPKRTKEESIKLFAPDLCRYIELRYKEEVVINGLTGYKYDAGPYLMDNGTLDERNKCFCVGECIPRGVLDVSACRLGAPVYVSYPHFHHADPYYVNGVVGMKPDPENHHVCITLEPTYGIVLDVSARIQINFLVEPDDKISLLNKVPRMFFPILWFEQRVTTPAETLSLLKILVILPTAGFVTSLILMTAGTILLLIFGKIRWNKNRKTLVISSCGFLNKNKIPTSTEDKIPPTNKGLPVLIVKSIKDTHL